MISLVNQVQVRRAFAQALANTRIEGHVPSEAFVADCEAVIAGVMTDEQAIEASKARALARDFINA